MSNLKLPTLSHANLANIIADKCAVQGQLITLAYATQIRRVNKAIELLHHGSPIATLEADGTIYLDTHGYDTQTTAGRLHKVLVDNQTGFKVGIRQGETWLLDTDAKKLRPLSTAKLRPYLLIEVNGERIGGSL